MNEAFWQSLHAVPDPYLYTAIAALLIAYAALERHALRR